MQNIAACRPKDLEKLPEEVRSQITIYDGEVEGECEGCHVSVMIGPRMQELIATEKRKPIISCFFCAAVVANAMDSTIYDLGNPQGAQEP